MSTYSYVADLSQNFPQQSQGDKAERQKAEDQLKELNLKRTELENLMKDIKSRIKEHEKKINDLNTKILKFNSTCPHSYNKMLTKYQKSIDKRNEVLFKNAKILEILNGIQEHNAKEEEKLENLMKKFLEDQEEYDKKTIASIVYRDCRILIRQANLVDERVDAIVNPANEMLKHEGGAAKAILQAGGETINEECKAYLSQHEKLYTGKAMTTGPGNLPCNHIIHVVGPIWKKKMNNSDARTKLREALINMLKEFETNKCKSISFPAISTGVFRFPADI